MNEPAQEHKLEIHNGNIQVPHGCTPQCDGMTCGDDGCGGTCGTCAEGETCDMMNQVCCTSDLDGDGVCDEYDCAPDDAGSYGMPAEVDTLWLSPDGAMLHWNPLSGEEGPGTVYDICRGVIAELPAGGGAGDACIAQDVSVTELAITADPPAGVGWHYEVRGDNSCGAGTFGHNTEGTERNPAVCP